MREVGPERIQYEQVPIHMPMPEAAFVQENRVKEQRMVICV